MRCAMPSGCSCGPRLRPGGQPALVVESSSACWSPPPGKATSIPVFRWATFPHHEGCLALVVASRRPLVAYLATRGAASPDLLLPPLPGPLTLESLEEEAADALLLQPRDHPLTLAEAAEAESWAGGHPAHLRATGRPSTRPGRTRTGGRGCATRNCAARVASQPGAGGLPRARRFCPLAALERSFGRRPWPSAGWRNGWARVDDVAAWLLGLALIIVWCCLPWAG